MLGLYYWHLLMCVLISATANLAKVESTFHVGGRLTFSSGFALWRLLFLHTCRQTTWCTQDKKTNNNKKKTTHSYTYTRFHRQRLSFVKVGEDQSDGCQSLTLENTNRKSGWWIMSAYITAVWRWLLWMEIKRQLCRSNTLTHSLCDGISQVETGTAASSLKLLVIKAKTTDHLSTGQHSGSWWLYVWNLSGCDGVAHQSHVIRQYSSTNPLRCFFGRETCEAVKVQLASLLPEGWQ